MKKLFLFCLSLVLSVVFFFGLMLFFSETGIFQCPKNCNQDHVQLSFDGNRPDTYLSCQENETETVFCVSFLLTAIFGFTVLPRLTTGKWLWQEPPET
jgi:hypothetical protein